MIDYINQTYTISERQLEASAKIVKSWPIQTQLHSEIILNDRFYLHRKPCDLATSHDVIIYYHGSRDIAITQSEYTNLLSLNDKYIIAFGQASGEQCTPYVDEYGFAAFGEIYWGLAGDQFEEDLLYTRALILDLQDQYNINNIYFIGHSNSGVFALLLALYLPNTFTKIVSHMGGIGYDPCLQLQFNQDARKTPILFYTGEYDLHKEACESAKTIFISQGFEVDLYIEQGLGHEYHHTCESYILKWLTL